MSTCTRCGGALYYPGSHAGWLCADGDRGCPVCGADHSPSSLRRTPVEASFEAFLKHRLGVEPKVAPDGSHYYERSQFEART